MLCWGTMILVGLLLLHPVQHRLELLEVDGRRDGRHALSSVIRRGTVGVGQFLQLRAARAVPQPLVVLAVFRAVPHHGGRGILPLLVGIPVRLFLERGVLELLLGNELLRTYQVLPGLLALILIGGVRQVLVELWVRRVKLAVWRGLYRVPREVLLPVMVLHGHLARRGTAVHLREHVGIEPLIGCPLQVHLWGLQPGGDPAVSGVDAPSDLRVTLLRPVREALVLMLRWLRGVLKVLLRRPLLRRWAELLHWAELLLRRLLGLRPLLELGLALWMALHSSVVLLHDVLLLGPHEGGVDLAEIDVLRQHWGRVDHPPTRCPLVLGLRRIAVALMGTSLHALYFLTKGKTLH